ncbi:site-2 protease family protein [bacterium]|nr:site-2 protease family protein [bacterium]
MLAANESVNYTQILLLLPGFVIGLTVHEFFHAWTAARLGDPTAKTMGRLTLNPLRHLDFFGSLMLVFIGFGWAKPVPVDPRYFRSPYRDMAMVAVAGPLSNLGLGIAFAFLLRLSVLFMDPTAASLPWPLMVLAQAVWINIVLAIFNLIPIPPLDGSRIVSGFIPERWARGYERFERIGPLLFIAVVLLANFADVSVFGRIIMPVAQPLFRLFVGVG